jgi:hypothetical protein
LILEEYFKYSFGITVDGDIEDVILKFTVFQGNYLKTLKIHPTTQEVLIDSEDSHNFKEGAAILGILRKILGYGNNVQALSPSKKVINQYKKNIEPNFAFINKHKKNVLKYMYQ